MRDHEQQIKNKGANLAAIGLGGMDFARQFREEFQIDFPLLVDEDSSAHRAANLRKANVFHLFRSDNATYRKRAKREGMRQTGVKKDPFQLGGSFVFAPGDRDLFVYVSETFGDNARMEDLIAAIPKS